MAAAEPAGRFTTVRLAAPKAVGHQLLAHDVHRGAVDQRVAGAAGDGDAWNWPERLWVGSVPDCWPRRKIIGATGSGETEAALPPHSGPQFSTYAVPPSAEKTALTGRSKTSGP